MSLRYLLDTNVISDPVAKSPTRGIIERLEQHEGRCAIAAPIWHELMFGIRRLSPGRKRQMLQAYVGDVVRAAFPILPYDDEAAEWHAQERARLQRAGKVPAFVDGQIAAIAHVHDLVLVTKNLKDFRPFRGLSIEDWSKPTRGR